MEPRPSHRPFPPKGPRRQQSRTERPELKAEQQGAEPEVGLSQSPRSDPHHAGHGGFSEVTAGWEGSRGAERGPSVFQSPYG